MFLFTRCSHVAPITSTSTTSRRKKRELINYEDIGGERVKEKYEDEDEGEICSVERITCDMKKNCERRNREKTSPASITYPQPKPYS
jgi:hypothetical protein